MTALFDPGPRTDDAPGRHGEPIYSVLNRRAGDAWQRVRDLVQEWFDDVPVDVADRNDLGRRLTSSNDDLRGAFLELYCHQLLLRSGYQVEHHPPIACTTKHPDFAGTRNGSDLYLEATAMNPSPKTAGKQARMAKLVDDINARIPTGAFSLNLIVEQAGAQSAPTSQICTNINEHVAKLDPEHFDPEHPNSRWEWSNGDWILKFSANPLAQEHRNDGLRIVGTHGPGVHVLDEVDPTAVLKKKVTKYGRTRLGRPYVIGTDVQGYPDDDDVTNALYGNSYLDVTTTPGSPTWRWLSNGIWRDQRGWVNPHLSAILTADDLSPFNVARMVPAIWHHPDPTFPIENPFTVAKSSRRDPTTGEIHWTPAVTNPPEFFGLEPGWPGWESRTPRGAAQSAPLARAAASPVRQKLRR